jgi:hypothetical protein
MPARGVDLVDGIPVYLKGNVMYAFRHEHPAGQPELPLGTYSEETKKGTWDLSRPGIDAWLQEFRANLAARSRK